MKKALRRITLILALTMLFTPILAACAKEDEEKGTYWWELGTEGRSAVPDNLPEDLDYDGYEVTIFHRSGFTDETAGRDDDNSEPVEAVTYQRNRKIEKRLNVKLTWQGSSIGSIAGTSEEITNILNTNQYYDFILTTNNTIVTYKKNEYLCDLSEARYLDFEQDWWWDEYMDEMAYDGVTYNYAVGDINISNVKKLSAMYVNFGLSKEILNMESQAFYDLVNNKEWTLDTFYSLTKNCYKDTDKNPLYSGQKDDGDIYGFAWSGAETIQQILYSTSVVNEFYTRDEGQYYVTLNLENNRKIQDLCELVTNLIWQNDGARDRRVGDETTSVFDSDIIKDFAEGNYVFLAQRLTAACSSYLRGTSVDFGILPYPTLEKGDDYISYGETSATCICIPLTVKTKDNEKLNRASAVIEALCAESYRYTIDAFYKDALQTKYTRDPESVKMIDIIYESRNKNFLIEYNSAAGSILNQMYQAIKTQNSIETLFAQKLDSSQVAINKYIKDLLDSKKTA